jgi:hypothetical protein
MSRNSTSSTPRWVPWILTKPALEARSMPVRSLCPDLIDHQLRVLLSPNQHWLSRLP